MVRTLLAWTSDKDIANKNPNYDVQQHTYPQA